MEEGEEVGEGGAGEERGRGKGDSQQQCYSVTVSGHPARWFSTHNPWL